MQHDIPELDTKGLREFSLLTGAIIACLFGLFFPFVLGFNIPIWPFIIGAVLVLWGLAAPKSLNPVYKGWMKFGIAIGWFMNRVILSIVFYMIFFPTSLIMKIGGYDPMHRKLDKTAKTYRIDTSQRDISHMNRPY